MWQDTRSLRQKITDLFFPSYSPLELEEFKRLTNRAAKEEILTGDPGSAPTRIAGLVLNPKNAKKIRDLFFAQSPNFGDNIDIALKFIQTKYPKLSKLVKDVEIKNTNKERFGVFGDYSPGSNRINLYRKILEEFGPSQAVETYTHELIHALRNRNQKLTNMYLSNIDILDPRLLQTEERLATRGGNTGRRAFAKYKDLIRDIE